MVGTLIIGDFSRITLIKFGSFDYYESYINSIDQGYVPEHSNFNRLIYILNIPELSRLNGNQYGKGCEFEHEGIEYHGKKHTVLSNVLIS